jgi:negative regulator of flagellin synthesis FlgM
VKINTPVGQPTQVQPGFSSSKIGKIESNKPVSMGTQIQVSDQLQALGARKSSSSFDAQKVQNIRTAIAEGRFEVNVDKVADSLISSVADLIQSRSRTA